MGKMWIALAAACVVLLSEGVAEAAVRRVPQRYPTISDAVDADCENESAKVVGSVGEEERIARTQPCDDGAEAADISRSNRNQGADRSR